MLNTQYQEVEEERRGEARLSKAKRRKEKKVRKKGESEGGKQEAKRHTQDVIFYINLTSGLNPLVPSPTTVLSICVIVIICKHMQLCMYVGAFICTYILF